MCGAQGWALAFTVGKCKRACYTATRRMSKKPATLQSVLRTLGLPGAAGKGGFTVQGKPFFPADTPV